MLSRVADSIYWMSRYVERAENVARFIEVNLQLMLDAPAGQDQQWQPLVNITGDHEDFAKRCGAPTQPNVIEFLASEMWLQLNKFYLMVNSAAENPKALSLLQEFFSEVKNASHLFTGKAAAT